MHSLQYSSGTVLSSWVVWNILVVSAAKECILVFEVRTPHVKIGDSYPAARVFLLLLVVAFFVRIVFTFQYELLSLHCIFCHNFTACAIVRVTKGNVRNNAVNHTHTHTKRLLKIQSHLVIVTFNACSCSRRRWQKEKEANEIKGWSVTYKNQK